MADLSVSEVSICNMALSKIGASSNIESLTESSAEAKNVIYGIRSVVDRH